jgi:DnaJ-class molecular chaperone
MRVKGRNKPTVEVKSYPQESGIVIRIDFDSDPATWVQIDLSAEDLDALRHRDGATITSDDPQECPACRGNGYVGQRANSDDLGHKCGACFGTGQVSARSLAGII